MADYKPRKGELRDAAASLVGREFKTAGDLRNAIRATIA